MTQAKLQAKNIILKTPKGKTLLDQVDLSVEAGHVHALLGPNGAGKSTLLKVLSGDLQAQQGDVYIDEENISNRNKRQLALQRAVLPQLSGMAFPLSVEEVVAMGRYPHRHIDAEKNTLAIEQAMDLAEVKHLEQRSYPSLSGGEQQRTQLARVLAQQADILLLDEPLSALDISHQLQIMELLKTLAQGGKAIVVVLHDINLAMRYSTSVTLLKSGQVYAQGSTKEVMTQKNLKAVFSVASQVRECSTLGVEQAILENAI